MTMPLEMTRTRWLGAKGAAEEKVNPSQWFSSKGAAEEKVNPFVEDTENINKQLIGALLVSYSSSMAGLQRQPLENTATIFSRFTDNLDLYLDKEYLDLFPPCLKNQFNDDTLYDFWLSTMPKSVEEFKAEIKYVGKGQPKFHFDFEID